MPHEVAIPGGILSGNHRQTVWKKRQLKLLLQSHKSFLLKAFYGLLPFQLLHTDRIFRIYIIDYQRQAIQLTIIHLHFHQNGHPLGKRRACHGLEIWGYETVF